MPTKFTTAAWASGVEPAAPSVRAVLPGTGGAEPMEGPDREREAARAMIRFHRLSKRYGLSSMNMCFLFLADLLEGAPVSKSGIADRLGVTRAGVDKMIGKTEDLVTMEKLVTGRYRLHVTDKGKNLIYSIAEQIEEIRK